MKRKVREGYDMEFPRRQTIDVFIEKDRRKFTQTGKHIHFYDWIFDLGLNCLKNYTL